MSTAENRLFEATFNIANVNNQKYDRVSRISGNSLDEANIFFSLDVNTELYPCNEGEKVQILLALSLNADGTKDDTKGWREVGRGDMTLADDYEYVCHGKIYKFEESEDDNMYATLRYTCHQADNG